jgi:hypothetical protein
MAKMSLWQFHRLGFEPLTFEMVKNVPYLTPGPVWGQQKSHFGLILYQLS